VENDVVVPATIPQNGIRFTIDGGVKLTFDIPAGLINEVASIMRIKELNQGVTLVITKEELWQKLNETKTEGSNQAQR
jgi:hypothetical protein